MLCNRACIVQSSEAPAEPCQKLVSLAQLLCLAPLGRLEAGCMLGILLRKVADAGLQAAASLRLRLRLPPGRLRE